VHVRHDIHFVLHQVPRHKLLGEEQAKEITEGWRQFELDLELAIVLQQCFLQLLHLCFEGDVFTFKVALVHLHTLP
jgi:hypothetical protein